MDEDPLVWIAIIAIALLFSKFSPFYRSKKKRTALEEHEARGEANAPAVKEHKTSLKNKVFMTAFLVLVVIEA